MGRHEVARPVTASRPWAQNFMLVAAAVSLFFVGWDHIKPSAAPEVYVPVPSWMKVTNADGSSVGWLPASSIASMTIDG